MSWKNIFRADASTPKWVLLAVAVVMEAVLKRYWQSARYEGVCRPVTAIGPDRLLVCVFVHCCTSVIASNGRYPNM